MASKIISGCVNLTFQQFPILRRSFCGLSARLESFSRSMQATKSNNIVYNGGPDQLGTLGLQQMRFRMKDYFKRPSEHKRIARHGWKKRMSTPAGRMIIMRRLLKGRHILSH